MDSPVKSSAAQTGTGAVVARPCYVKSLWVVSGASAGAVTLTDGVGGATILDIDTAAGADNDYLQIPGRGIRCETGAAIGTLTNVTSVTLFYE